VPRSSVFELGGKVRCGAFVERCWLAPLTLNVMHRNWKSCVIRVVCTNECAALDGSGHESLGDSSQATR
jgi:hypothetical protein